jgi:hypothetical protein
MEEVLREVEVKARVVVRRWAWRSPKCIGLHKKELTMRHPLLPSWKKGRGTFRLAWWRSVMTTAAPSNKRKVVEIVERRA